MTVMPAGSSDASESTGGMAAGSNPSAARTSGQVAQQHVAQATSTITV